MIDGVETIVCEVIAEPFAAPSVNDTETVVEFVTDALTEVGADGTVAANGIADVERDETPDVPIPFVAEMVN